jgi:hypothetical protein
MTAAGGRPPGSGSSAVAEHSDQGHIINRITEQTRSAIFGASGVSNSRAV